MAFTAIIGAGVAAGASVYGSSQTAGASKKAAALQYQSTQNALATQQGMFNQAQANLQPYLALGQQATGTLQNRLQELTTPYAFVAPDLSNPASIETNAPGYQFTLDQGLKAAQNSAAARGLGLSGAALKGATSYATGLANQTYGDVFNRSLQAYNTTIQNQQNTYNRLLQAAQVGGSVASNFASASNTAAANMGSTAIQGGNALATGLNSSAAANASGLTGAANAFTGGLSNYNGMQFLQAAAQSKGVDTSNLGIGNKLSGLFMGA